MVLPTLASPLRPHPVEREARRRMRVTTAGELEGRMNTTRCSLCGQVNYRACPCPWHKPFGLWPHYLLAQLKRLVHDGWDER